MIFFLELSNRIRNSYIFYSFDNFLIDRPSCYLWFWHIFDKRLTLKDQLSSMGELMHWKRSSLVSHYSTQSLKSNIHSTINIVKEMLRTDFWTDKTELGSARLAWTQVTLKTLVIRIIHDLSFYCTPNPVLCARI